MSLAVTADNPEKIAPVIGAFSCFRGRCVYYLSTPITGGRLKLMGLPAEKVSYLNRRAAEDAEYILTTRNRGTVPIINPFHLSVAGLTWNDYIVVWEKVIQGLAHAVHLVPGWEYSDGCCYELLVAIKAGIPCYEVFPWYPDEQLSLMQAANRIAKTADEFALTGTRQEVWMELQRMSHAVS